MSYKVFNEEISENELKISATIMKIENATITIFDEKESLKLGTLAVAMPQFEGKTCISSILLGERNQMITKILAEYMSRTFNGIALVSTHLVENSEMSTSSTLMKLAQKLVEKTKE